MEEISRLHRKIQKLSKDGDAGELRELLRALERQTVTYAVLKETKLGHTVGKLRKHSDEKVANLAKMLVRNWKSVALSPRPNASPASSEKSNDGAATTKTSLAAKASTSSSNGSSAKTPSNGSNNTTSIAKTSGSPQKPKPSPVKPKAKSPLVIPSGLDKVRATVRTRMKEILDASEGGDSAEVATAIEIAMARMFNMGFPGENKKDYTAKFRQLSFNLKKNASLREDLLNDMVSAEQLINMTPEELATEEKRMEIQKLRDDAFQKARLDWADANEDKINKQCGIENSKGLFTCGRCKSSKTSNTQKQTRSADEPMTVFVQCHNCGNRWKC